MSPWVSSGLHSIIKSSQIWNLSPSTRNLQLSRRFGGALGRGGCGRAGGSASCNPTQSSAKPVPKGAALIGCVKGGKRTRLKLGSVSRPWKTFQQHRNWQRCLKATRINLRLACSSPSARCSVHPIGVQVGDVHLQWMPRPCWGASRGPGERGLWRGLQCVPTAGAAHVGLCGRWQGFPEHPAHIQLCHAQP